MTAITYNIVSFCKLCRKRMVRPKGQTTWYCEECERIIRRSEEKEARENESKNKKSSKSKKKILRKKTSRKRK